MDALHDIDPSVKPQERHNAICNVAGEVIWGFQGSLVPVATVLTVLLLQLGAKTQHGGAVADARWHHADDAVGGHLSVSQSAHASSPARFCGTM